MASTRPVLYWSQTCKQCAAVRPTLEQMGVQSICVDIKQNRASMPPSITHLPTLLVRNGRGQWVPFVGQPAIVTYIQRLREKQLQQQVSAPPLQPSIVPASSGTMVRPMPMMSQQRPDAPKDQRMSAQNFAEAMSQRQQIAYQGGGSSGPQLDEAARRWLQPIETNINKNKVGNDGGSGRPPPQQTSAFGPKGPLPNDGFGGTCSFVGAQAVGGGGYGACASATSDWKITTPEMQERMEREQSMGSKSVTAKDLESLMQQRARDVSV